jgi:hypothetical protein
LICKLRNAGIWVGACAFAIGPFAACGEQRFDDCTTASECVGSPIGHVGGEPPTISTPIASGRENGGGGSQSGQSSGQSAGARSVGGSGITAGDGGTAGATVPDPSGAGQGGTSSDGDWRAAGQAGVGGAPPIKPSGCRWDEPFETVATLASPFNGIVASESFWISPDGLVAYFGYQAAKKNFDLLVTTRVPSSAHFFSPQSVFGPTELTVERQMSLSGDQLVLAYQNQVDVYLTMRQSLSEQFDLGAALPEPVNLAGYDAEPSLTNDGEGLYFVSDRLGSSDIFFVALVAGLPVGNAFSLGINTEGYEAAPVISGDGLDLYYQTDLPDATMWVAHRDSVDAEFTEKRRLDEINTTSPEFPEHVSQDGCTLYFLTSVVGGYRIDEARKTHQ